jgi:hypothetical protein
VTRRGVTLAVMVAVIGFRSAAAQTVDPPLHRFEATLGALWLGGGELGSEDAELRPGGVSTGGFPLFRTDTNLEASPGFDGRVAFWLMRWLAIEAGFVMTRPVVRTRVTDDDEGAGDVTLDENLDQYFVEASAVLLLDRFRIGDRTVPFVSGGGGYLRQLHEGRTLVETGQAYHVGGGLRHWLRVRDSGFLRAAGLRVDARAYMLVNGFAADGGARPHAALSGALFLTF